MKPPKYNIGQLIKDDNRDFVITEHEIFLGRRNAREHRYKYKCNKCGFDCGRHYNIKKCIYEDEYWITQNGINAGNGCPCCRKSPFIIVKGINDISTLNKDIIKYIKNEEDIYTHLPNSNDPIELKCPICGRVKIDSLNGISSHGFSCMACSDGVSYPEKVIMEILDSSNIKYIKEYSCKNNKWVGKYRYDYYLLDYNAIIEVHGIQHYKNIKLWNENYSQEEIDRDKRELALSNGIETYIELDCRYSNIEYIKNSILNSNLKCIINLDEVDWDYIDNMAQNKNAILEVCNYYNENKNVLLKDIADIFGIATVTVREYLHKGNNLGLCNYEGNKKKVYVYKDKVLIKSYDSISDMERNSLQDLNIKSCSSGISQALKRYGRYKGYIIKEIKE